MRTRCEELRERALSDGLDSKSALSWRVHARACSDCRTELRILETLECQARRDRTHLGRNEMSVLLQSVAKQHPPARPAAVAWTWSLRFACAALVCLVAAGFFVNDQGATGGAGRAPAVLAQADLSAGPATGVVLPAAGPSLVQAEAPDNVSDLSDRVLDQRMSILRRRVDVRRDSLLELIDRDLGERTRDDAWDGNLVSVAAIA